MCVAGVMLMVACLTSNQIVRVRISLPAFSAFSVDVLWTSATRVPLPALKMSGWQNGKAAYLEIIMVTIEIYPEEEKPEWMKLGAWCYCWGESYDVFYVEIIGKNAAFLKTKGGRGHGWESFRKLHRGEQGK